jgi:hypothetical protein
MSFTQHHHWGVIEHGIRACVFEQQIANEYLWEFLQPEEVLENMFGITTINLFLFKGGGFELVDQPDPYTQFHQITVWAYHPDPRMLTWISLQKI